MITIALDEQGNFEGLYVRKRQERRFLSAAWFLTNGEMKQNTIMNIKGLRIILKGSVRQLMVFIRYPFILMEKTMRMWQKQKT